MKEWYALANSLETDVKPLDELATRRIRMQAAARLPKRRSRWRVAVIAAVILLLTACGVMVSQYSQWFWNLVQDPLAPEASEELLASMGTVIDQSQTVDGVTVTLHGALYDGEFLTLSLSVEGDSIPETDHRTILCERSGLFYSRAQYEKNLQNSSYREVLEPEDWDAYYRDYLSWYDQMTEWHSVQLKSRTNYREEYRVFTLQEKLIWKGDETSEPVELVLHLQDMQFENYTVEGPFDFTFSIAANDARCVYEGAVPVELTSGVQILVEKIVVTPLRITVYFTGVGPFPEDTKLSFGIEKVYAGDQTAFSTQSSGVISHEQTEDSWDGYRQIGPLERVIDPEAVTAIQLGETVIDLSQLTLAE